MFIILFGLGERQQLGRIIFEKECLICHFEGNDLKPPAPVFSEYRIKPEYVFEILKNGLEGTPMRPFDNLTDKEKWEVAKFVSSMSTKKETLKIGKDIIARGKYVYETVCSPCHGMNGDGKGLGKLIPPPPDFKRFNPVPSTTIRILNEGIEGTNMYSFKDILSEEDKRAVAYYILLFYDE